MDIQIDDPELAALVNGEKSGETTPEENTAALETNTVPEPAQEEKPADKSESESKPADDDSESSLAEDETGNRYVPKKRFDKVYADLKAYERGERQPKAAPQPTQAQPIPSVVSKNEALEVELLTVKYPQFDPNSDTYDSALDELGSDIYKGNPGITRTEAARRALKHQKELAERLSQSQVQARQVKAVQSDQGITSRSTTKDSTPNPDSMSLEEKEAWLKANGAW